MFADVDVICDGALESSNRFYDEILMSEFVDQERKFAEEDGLPLEIFITFHQHTDEGDCNCIQYITDGRPKYCFNMGDQKGSWQ